jgi:hypothetical protein
MRAHGLQDLTRWPRPQDFPSLLLLIGVELDSLGAGQLTRCWPSHEGRLPYPPEAVQCWRVAGHSVVFGGNWVATRVTVLGRRRPAGAF